MPPFVKLLNSVKKMNDQWSLDIDSTLVCPNFIDGFDGVDHNQGIVVPSEFVKGLKEVCLLELLLGHVVELYTTNDGSLLYIGVNIIQAFLNCLLKILRDSFKSKGAQAS